MKAQPTAVRSRARSRVEPLHLLAIGIAAFLLVTTVKPLSETDLFWHVPLGQQIIDSHHVVGAGTGWTIAPGTGGWVSSEWLGEVVLAATHSLLGWQGILWLRLALALALIAGVLVMILRSSTARVAAVTMAAIGIPLASQIQERPQLVSLILLLPVSTWAHRALTTGRLPRMVLAAPLVLVWAQIHSLWVLLPGALGLALACRAFDHGWRSLVRPLPRLLGLVLVGCITPLGPRALLLPLKLHSATSNIAEWQPTAPLDTMAWGLLLLGALMVLAWSRSGRGRVPASELAYSAALTLFAFMAYRNLLPAMLLMLPVVTRRLSTMRWARASKVTARESRVLRSIGLTAFGVSIVMAGAATATSATFGSGVPIAIARQLASEPGEHRVLNAYNASGALVAFGGPGIRLAVDGRADRWGADYLNGYFDALSMKGDWRAYLACMNLTDAVLQSDAPIVGELVRDGWIRQLETKKYVLLKAPAA